MLCSVSPAKFFDRNQHCSGGGACMLLSMALRQQNMFIPALRVFYSPPTSWCILAIISLGIICRQEVQSDLLWYWEWAALEPRWSILFPESWAVWVTKALLASLCTYTGLEFGLTRLVGCTSLGGTRNGHLAAPQGAPEALWRLCLASGTKNWKKNLEKIRLSKNPPIFKKPPSIFKKNPEILKKWDCPKNPCQY